MLRIFLLLLVAMGIFAGIVGCMQRRMIYFPRPYSQDLLASMPDRLVHVPYEVGGNPQVAFYLPPKQEAEGDEPMPLWVLFHGNASVALYWVRWIEEEAAGTDRAGWLLVDYPGYGLNQGNPTRASIIESTEKVIPALASELGTTPEVLNQDINTLGFSIGAAAAAEFAVRHPIRNVVMMAPFTTLEAMARRSVGWPISNLLLDRFDNEARLDELANTDPRPNIVIIHGDRDSVVPYSHGRSLADRHPEMVQLVPVPGGDHGTGMGTMARILREMMADENVATLP